MDSISIENFIFLKWDLVKNKTIVWNNDKSTNDTHVSYDWMIYSIKLEHDLCDLFQAGCYCNSLALLECAWIFVLFCVKSHRHQRPWLFILLKRGSYHIEYGACKSRVYFAWRYKICGIFASLGTGSAQPSCFRSHVKSMVDFSLLQITGI